MSHLLENMAYVGDAPWHGLGHRLSPHQPIETWVQEAGMDWCIDETPVRYVAGNGNAPDTLRIFPDQKVLYRSDTQAALSVVSSRYQVVQPRQVLDFYRDLTEVSGYALETAGILKGGRKFWALARTGQSAAVKGSDVVHGYLLLASSCDGTLATTATPTTIRVVCNNTLAMALEGAPQAVRVPHNTRFDPDVIKEQLGIAVTRWDDFMHRMRLLANRKVKTCEAIDYCLQVLSPHLQKNGAVPNAAHGPALKVLRLYDGEGRGAELASAKGTAWGLLSAVTEYIDHDRRARSPDHRIDSAWFGPGAAVKQRALDLALQLAA